MSCRLYQICRLRVFRQFLLALALPTAIACQQGVSSDGQFQNADIQFEAIYNYRSCVYPSHMSVNEANIIYIHWRSMSENIFHGGYAYWQNIKSSIGSIGKKCETNHECGVFGTCVKKVDAAKLFTGKGNKCRIQRNFCAIRCQSDDDCKKAADISYDVHSREHCQLHRTEIMESKWSSYSCIYGYGEISWCSFSDFATDIDMVHGWATCIQTSSSPQER